MDSEQMTIQINDVHDLMNRFNLSFKNVVEFQRTKRIVDFLFDDNYLLRISHRKLDEIERLQRVQNVSHVPQIHAFGEITIKSSEYHYLILDYVKGIEMHSCLSNLSQNQSHEIGEDISRFMLNLQQAKNTNYDIGHYVPIIPQWNHSWKEGHLTYLKFIEDGLKGLTLSKSGEVAIKEAVDYIKDNAYSLDHMNGPVLLHNDLHPKNIILHEGKFMGVIDWECSQYGEADFELIHLFHWSIYPPINGISFNPLLKSIFEHFTTHVVVPEISKRLTIYQIEHDLIQLIWNGVKQEQERIMRINGWLSGQIESLIKSWSELDESKGN